MKNLILITTCRPSNVMAKFLELNPLLSQCILENNEIHVFNKKNELPNEIFDYEAIKIHSNFIGDRANLNDMLDIASNANAMVCNSDIFFEDRFLEKVEKLLERKCYSYSGRRYDLNSAVNYRNKHLFFCLSQFGFLQSSRTLDYFIICSNDIGDLKTLGHLYLGTIGFDIYLASVLNKKKTLVDATKFFSVFHRNHERFKEIFKTSILLNMDEALVFRESRAKSAIKKRDDLLLGDLAYCQNVLNSKGEIARNYLAGKLLCYFLKLKTLIGNKLEFYCYHLNLLMFSVCRREVTIFVLSRHMKIVVCLPIKKTTKLCFQESIEKYCLEFFHNKNTFD